MNTTGSPSTGYHCPNCGHWVYGTHSCPPPVYYTAYSPVMTPYIDDETKQLLKRLIELLEKMVKL